MPPAHRGIPALAVSGRPFAIQRELSGAARRDAQMVSCYRSDRSTSSNRVQRAVDVSGMPVSDHFCWRLYAGNTRLLYPGR